MAHLLTYARTMSTRETSSTPAIDSAGDSGTGPQGDDEGPNRYERFRAQVARNRTLDLAYRTLVTVVGFGIIIVGLLLLPLPGPGWVIIFLGLGLLATEYEWSRRLLEYARRQLSRWVDWVKAQPVYIRALLGLAGVAIIAAAVVAYIWWTGVPGWLPDWVPIVDSLPTRS